MLITFIIVGIWQGPFLTLFSWGILHGVAIIICYVFVTNRYVPRFFETLKAPPAVSYCFGVILTYGYFCFCTTLFQSVVMYNFFETWKGALGLIPLGKSSLEIAHPIIYFLGLTAIHYFLYKYPIELKAKNLPMSAFLFIAAFIVCAILILRAAENFQFAYMYI